ncbi:hypothetical protein ACLOJK_008383 [Asimina triloba]
MVFHPWIRLLYRFNKGTKTTRSNSASSNHLPDDHVGKENVVGDHVSKREEDWQGDDEETHGVIVKVCCRSLVEDLTYKESPGSLNATKRVVVVMDAMKDFSTGTLEWALLHVMQPGYVVMLLGVMPWLNVPLACKTWLDIWTINLKGLLALRDWSEWKNDSSRCQKIRKIVDLCDNYKVVPYMKVAMGYPSRLVVVEEIANLHATWVVFDRHHQKDKEFYAERMPLNMMMMNNEGEVEMLKGKKMIKGGDSNTTPEASPGLRPLTAKVIISDHLMQSSKNKEWTWRTW